MDTFTIFITILLILSVVNNIFMYNKYYISRNIPSFDSFLNKSIIFFPLNIYYSENENGDEITKIIKNFCSELQNRYNVYFTYATPTIEEYEKINNLSKI